MIRAYQQPPEPTHFPRRSGASSHGFPSLPPLGLRGLKSPRDASRSDVHASAAEKRSSPRTEQLERDVENDTADQDVGAGFNLRLTPRSHARRPLKSPRRRGTKRLVAVLLACVVLGLLIATELLPVQLPDTRRE